MQSNKFNLELGTKDLYIYSVLSLIYPIGVFLGRFGLELLLIISVYIGSVALFVGLIFKFKGLIHLIKSGYSSKALIALWLNIIGYTFQIISFIYIFMLIIDVTFTTLSVTETSILSNEMIIGIIETINPKIVWPSVFILIGSFIIEAEMVMIALFYKNVFIDEKYKALLTKCTIVFVMLIILDLIGIWVPYISATINVAFASFVCYFFYRLKKW